MLTLNTRHIIVGLLYVGSKKVHEDTLVAIFADRITAPTDGCNQTLPGCVERLISGEKEGNIAREITLNLVIPAIIRLL